jgi:TonB family protein
LFRKPNGILGLNLQSGTQKPDLPKPYAPGHKVVVANGVVTLQVTGQHEGRMTVEVSIALPDVKGSWNASLLPGQLRLFAADISQARRTQKGTNLPLFRRLALLAYYDDKQQKFCFGVKYQSHPVLAVIGIFGIPIESADWSALIDSLQTADPGELTPERVPLLRQEMKRVMDLTPPDIAPPTPMPPVPPDHVVLTIGDEAITAAEFARLIESVPVQRRAATRHEFARQLIRRRVMAQEARRRHLDETGRFKEHMVQAAEQFLAMELQTSLQAGIQVDEAACRAYYDEHPDGFDRARVRRILIRTPGSSSPVRVGQVALNDQQALAKAQEIRARLLQGADFVELARQESDEILHAARSEGDWWHRVAAGSQIPNSLNSAAFTLPIGEISDVIKNEQGYNVLQVQERQRRTYEEVRREIETRLKGVQRAKAEEELQSREPVILDPDYFAYTYPTEVECPHELHSLRSPSPEILRMKTPLRTVVNGGEQYVKLLRGSPPIYPPEAKAADITGHVILYALISQDGTLIEAQPAEGHPMLAAAAMEAARDWLWRATFNQGVAQEVITRLDFEFQLPKPSRPTQTWD